MPSMTKPILVVFCDIRSESREFPNGRVVNV